MENQPAYSGIVKADGVSAYQKKLILRPRSLNINGTVKMSPNKHLLIKTDSALDTINDMYLDLMKKSLTRALFAKSVERQTLEPKRILFRSLNYVIQRFLKSVDLELVRTVKSSPNDYLESSHAAYTRGEDAETMIGLRQLDQMQEAIKDVVARDVQGDLLEAGVWRGGMTIFMRAVLRTLEGNRRRIWVADSFSGLPTPNAEFDTFGWQSGEMAVALEEVKANFERYGLLDGKVEFLKGYFNETLPSAPIEKLSILRVDADLYESTKDVLNSLYPKLSVGGYAIFDDYLNLEDCRKAIDEYRSDNDIGDRIVRIDNRSVYWIKTG